MLRSANREKWTTLINEWRQSGLSQKAFCQQRQLNLHSLQYWRKIVDEAESSTADTRSKTGHGFVPLQVAGTTTTEIRIALSHQVKLEVPLVSLSSVLTQLKQAGWL